MKYFFLFFLSLCLIGFKQTATNQQRYLPVFISLTDTSNLPPELLVNLKAVFGSKKIKTLTKKESADLIYNEIYKVSEDYARSGGNMADYDKLKYYQSANMRNVGNNLVLSIKIDSDGFINDTVKWYSYTLPMDVVKFSRQKWRHMLLDSTNAKTMLQMTQSIVDSIITSNVLVKE